MIFNEILVPQDSFTETNVTRNRSVVGIFVFLEKNKKNKKNINFTIFYKTRYLLMFKLDRK